MPFLRSGLHGMEHPLFILCGLLLTFVSEAQNIKGIILDTNEKPIAGASVYIKEKKQGLVCNEAGEFQTKILPGTYHIQFSCLGYETEQEEVTIRANTDEPFLKIILLPKYFELKEVVVGVGEDPAYQIIRNTIKKAPFYRSQVKESTYEAYIKGSGKMTNMPKLLEKLSGEDMDLYKNKLFLQESFSEINFTEPDKYVQTVKAFSSSMPDNFDPKDAIGVATASLYTPLFMGFVSPLNPKSFSYYNFRFEGFDDTEGEIINKIKVIPKLKDPLLLEGYLYIADQEWNIRHAELTAHPMGTTIVYDINYNQVAEEAYLPTSYTMNVDVSLMGVKFNFDYLSTLKYLQVQLNDSLIAQETKTKNKKEKKSLEVKRDDRYKVESDSLASKRDSSYWEIARNIPLNKEEILSYERKDSLQAVHDSIKQEKLHPTFELMDIVMGGGFGGDSSKVYFNYGGLIRVFPEYNFVDGFWAGQAVELGIRRNENSILRIKPKAYWAWSREELLWNATASYTYAPLRLGELTISGGSLSEDYNAGMGMLPIENAMNSLFMGVNKVKLYQKTYVSIENQIDIANGLSLGLSVEMADRKVLSNHTTYSFFGKEDDAESNIPDYPGNLNANYNTLTKYNVSLKYTPEYYYMITKSGKKRYLRSRFPTFYLSYQQGIHTNSESSQFNCLDFSVSQSIKLSVFDKFQYTFVAGKYFNNNTFNYIDYKHFNSANQWVTGKTFEDSYSLLDYYTYSTNKYWIQAFAAYNTQYLLLKRLPFLQGKLFSESVLGKFLHTPDKRYYSEWGYAVGIRGLGSIGIFTSFDSFKYNSFGVSVSLPLIKLYPSVR